MFIESVNLPGSISPFMGERGLVSRLKALPLLNWIYGSINISPLRGFSR